MAFPTDQGHPVAEFTNIWRRFLLPDYVFSDTTFYVTGWHSFEAYLDGILINRVGSLYPDPMNKLANYSWHLIPLPPGYSGKTLYFRTYSAYPDVYWNRAPPSVASRSDQLVDMVRREFAKLQRRRFNKRFLWEKAADDYITQVCEHALADA
jgi:hypothetical protein